MRSKGPKFITFVRAGETTSSNREGSGILGTAFYKTSSPFRPHDALGGSDGRGFEHKKAKYQDLVDECREGGWRVWCLPVEVGYRGFVSQSLWRALPIIGITGTTRKQLVNAAVSINVDLEEES